MVGAARLGLVIAAIVRLRGRIRGRIWGILVRDKAFCNVARSAGASMTFPLYPVLVPALFSGLWLVFLATSSAHLIHGLLLRCADEHANAAVYDRMQAATFAAG
jgi:hypothetical protein